MPKFSMDNLPPAAPSQQRLPRRVATPLWDLPGGIGYNSWDEEDRDPYEYGGTGTSEDVNPNEGSK